MSQKTKLDKIRKAIEEKFQKPNIAGTVDEFNNHDETYSGLWMSAEDGNLWTDGNPVFNYYGYEMGTEDTQPHVHPEACRWLEKMGVWIEYHDPGTVMIYLNE